MPDQYPCPANLRAVSSTSKEGRIHLIPSGAKTKIWNEPAMDSAPVRRPSILMLFIRIYPSGLRLNYDIVILGVLPRHSFSLLNSSLSLAICTRQTGKYLHIDIRNGIVPSNRKYNCSTCKK